MDSGEDTATLHLLGEFIGKQIRLCTTYHECRELDRHPVFPEIKAILPRIAKRLHNLRVAEHDEPFTFRIPGHAMLSKVCPMFIGQVTKRRQNLANVCFCVFQADEVSWR